MLTINDGKLLIDIARREIEGKKWECKVENLKKAYGSFVTLNTYPEGQLRGCIGIIEPIYPLCKAVAHAAKSAAYNDPRFIFSEEINMDKITVEVSVLMPYEEITFKDEKDLLSKINSKEGLILKYEKYSSVLLPQVWEEVKDKEEFLKILSLKAKNDPNLWKKEGVRIYKFKVIAFKEKTPKGDIIREEYLG